MIIYNYKGTPKDEAWKPQSLESYRNTGVIVESWYTYQNNSTALTTGAPSGNAIRAFPFIAPGRGGIIGSLAFNVTTQLFGSGTIGIYNNTSPWNLYPSGLIYQSQYLTTSTVGVKSVTCSVPLEPGGLYWIVYWNTAAATLRSLAVAGAYSLLGLLSSTLTAPTIGHSWGQTLSTGVAVLPLSLPLNFPLGAQPIQAVPLPGLFFRFSA